MTGSGFVCECPKFWKLGKILVCLIGIGFIIILVAVWIMYFHLSANPERLGGLEITEVFLFALGMTILFLPLTGLMYIDLKDTI
jgi:hypothetical protein